MAKTKISQFDATAANNTDLNSISIAEGTAPSNINNAIRELMSQLADLNLGNEVLSTLKIDNLHLDGNTIVTLDTDGDLNLTPNGTGAVTIAKADINGGAIDGTPIGASSASTGAFSTLSASSTANLGSTVTISGGNIDGVIGANTPAAITGTVITANTNFAGNLTGNVTGTVDGVVGGTTPAAVTGTTITANTKFVGAIDGNVTATSGTSTFNNVTINGTLDMDSTTSQTITGLATPSGSTDAATKGYVDTEVSGLVDSAPAALNTLNELAAALGDDASFSTTVTNSIAAKLPLAGGTMTGDINANSNTVSGLKAPSASNDATTKTYVDTADALKLNLSGGTLSGNLAMGSNKVTGLDTPTATGDATTKGYVDGILGSATAAATSASAAATSATASATSATASASSATAAASSATSAASSYDSFDDRYLGAKGSAPTVDNDGDALLTGALYFNTSSNQLFVWTSGDAWVQAAFTASGFLSGANNLSDVANAGTSRTNLGLGTAATLTAGTSANNAVQLDGSAKLPAVDGSALTGLASGGTVNKVADGAIAIRKPVVLTAAGKAKEVAETTTTDTTSMTLSNGSAGAQERGTNNVQRHSTTYDTNSDRFVTAYADDGNSGYGTAVVHTLSNASTGAMTYGTPVVFESADIDMGSDGTKYIVFDSSANRVVIAYRDRGDSDKGKAVVGSVNSGTNAISFGTPVEFEAGSTSFIATVYHPNVDRTVIFYNDNDDSTYGKGIVGTVTAGTNAIAFGTASNFHAGTTYNKAAAYEPDTHKILVAYDDRTGGDTGEAVVATVTGGTDNSIAYGSATQFNDNVPASISMDYDTTANKFVISFKDEGNSNASTAIVGTISGTSVSFGSKVVIESTNSADRVVLFDPDLERTMLVYLDTTNDKIKLHYIAISGTTPSSLGSLEVATTDDAGGCVSAAYDPDNNKFVVMFQDSDDDLNAMMINSAFGSSTTTTLTSANYLGISAAAISDGATGKININGGISEGHSSLAIGTNYFATDAGAIATSGTQLIGKALSATEIQLGVKSGTAAHNTVALDANAKLPAVDGSQLTNLPSPSDARIFCGKVNVLNYGANSFTISLPTGTSASSVRAYEIYFYGLSATGEADHNFRFKPYNGGSSVLSGNNWDGIVHQVYGLGGSNTNTAQDMDVWSTFLTPISWGSENVLSHSEPIQTDTGNGYSPRMNGKIVYENNVENAGYVYESFGLFSTGSGEKFMMETGITGAQNTNTVTNYADAFYFYLGTGNFASGVVSVYAII